MGYIANTIAPAIQVARAYYWRRVAGSEVRSPVKEPAGIVLPLPEQGPDPSQRTESSSSFAMRRHAAPHFYSRRAYVGGVHHHHHHHHRLYSWLISGSPT